MAEREYPCPGCEEADLDVIPTSVSVSSGFFVLVAVVLAFEYYLGVLLYSTPILGRVKGWGISLMRESVEPMFFLFLMNCLFLFLVPLENDIWGAALEISNNANTIKTQMVGAQMWNYAIMLGAGTTGFFTSFAVSIVRFIIDKIPPNPLQIMGAGASAAQAATTVLSPVSSMYGAAILAQTFLAAFVLMLAQPYNLLFFVNLGTFLYIMPLNITRGTGKILLGFSLMGYALIPLYLQLQTFVQDWMTAALTGQWFSGIAARLQLLQVGVLDVLVPALYFGFLVWLVGGIAGGNVIGRISKQATGGISLMTPAEQLMKSGEKTIDLGSKQVQSGVKGAYKLSQTRKAYIDAKAQISTATIAGKTKGGFDQATKHLDQGEKAYHRGRLSAAESHFKQALANIKTARDPTNDELETDARNTIKELRKENPGAADEMIGQLPFEEMDFYKLGPDDKYLNWKQKTDADLSELEKKTEDTQTLFRKAMGITPKSIVERRKLSKHVSELVAAYREKYRSGQISAPALKLQLYSLRLSGGKVDQMMAEDDRLVAQQTSEMTTEAEADTREPEFLDRSTRVEAKVDKFEQRITELMGTIMASNWQDETAMGKFAEEMINIDKWTVITKNDALAKKVKDFQAQWGKNWKERPYDAQEEGPATSEEELAIVVGQSAENVLSNLQRRIEASIRRGSLDKRAVEEYDTFVREGLDPHSPLAHKAQEWKEKTFREMDQQAKAGSQRGRGQGGWGPPEQQQRPPLGGGEGSAPSDPYAQELQIAVSEEEVGRKLREEKQKRKAKDARRGMPADWQPQSKGELKKQFRRGDYSSGQSEAELGREEASAVPPADDIPEAKPKKAEPAGNKAQEDAKENPSEGNEQADTLLEYLKKHGKVDLRG